MIRQSEDLLGFKKGVDVNGGPLDPDKFEKLKNKRKRDRGVQKLKNMGELETPGRQS
jgi:hypothetical protein